MASPEYLIDPFSCRPMKCDNCRFFSIDLVGDRLVNVNIETGEVGVPGKCLCVNKHYGPDRVWSSEPCGRTFLPKSEFSKKDLEHVEIYGFLPKDELFSRNNED